MNAELLTKNAAVIDREIAWFRNILDARFKQHGQPDAGPEPLDQFRPQPLPRKSTPYAAVIREFEMTAAERLVLILAYLPHIKPEMLDPFLIHNQSVQRRFSEFGGVTGQSHGGFLPTGETAMFMLAGGDTAARLRFHHLFGSAHYFHSQNILLLDHRHPDEPPLSATLRLTAETVERLTTGHSYHPPYSPEFPAQCITTPFEWEDLVIDLPTRQDLQDIVAWIRHHDRLMHGWMLNKRLKAGYRCVFYGPPGTGKTMTAALLGKMTGLSVYRIDLSKVVSKYIGETEKNLASLFDHAQHQNWILFFDEADSLFGKRTETRNANDRAANQQVSYLLQRIEDFPGIVILATNLRAQLDEAFTRRFQSVTLFKMPNAEQRLRLWRDNFADKPYRLAEDVNLQRLAQEYELSGGSIINVLRYACLQAVVRNPQVIEAQDLFYGVKKELHKDGRFLS
jgi:hypothetical protein